MNKQQTIELLQKQIPSFYSLEQVIKIISDIEEEKLYVPYPESQISDELIDTIVDEISDQGRDLIDDYDLEMNYKEVELSDVQVDTNLIKRVIKSVLDKQ